MQTDPHPWLAPIPVARLERAASTEIALEPAAPARAALASELGILGIRKLNLRGTFSPAGRQDWTFSGTLGATVVQSCVVTLAPVTTRLDEPVRRYFTAAIVQPAPGSETEMPEDETVEPLGDSVDPGQIMAEALALALPQYPRAAGAELEQTVFAQRGVDPMSDAEARPFAGLSGLRDRLGKTEDE